jgi:RNA polymerase sigma factor (sigma-70 family)
MTTTTGAIAGGTAEVTTTSAPHESQHPSGRPDDGAAAMRSGELYARYGRTVTGLCRALLRDPAEAEDAAQQTFLSAHRALQNGTQPLEPAAWLATIARHECWARTRRRMREPLSAHELETASLQQDPLSEAIRRADLAALWAAIAALPRQQRDALLLREFGGLSYEELAKALAVSGPAVESLLFRARRQLRVQLRAAYASVSGASWIEALVRMFAGGGAPVAAKVAALGVGAAAVGSSAVVVPHAFDNHTHVRPTVPVPATVQHARRDAAPAPVPTEPIIPRGAAVTPAAPSASQERESRHDSGRGEGKGRSSGPHDEQGIEQALTSESLVQQPLSGRDDGDTEDRSGSSGTSGSSDTSGSSGSSGSSSSLELSTDGGDD